ncbi:MAG: hypothetical protein AABM40_05815 [Chloroflexota bacterium]
MTKKSPLENGTGRSDGGISTERKPLVQLRELAPKDFVEIFGKRYDVVDLDMLSIRERAVLGAHFERVLDIERKGEDVNDEDQGEHTERSKKLIKLLVPTLPDKVIAKIPPGRRGELLGAFLAWSAKRNLVFGLMERLASLPSSRTSRRRTAAARG